MAQPRPLIGIQASVSRLGLATHAERLVLAPLAVRQVAAATVRPGDYITTPDTVFVNGDPVVIGNDFVEVT